MSADANKTTGKQPLHLGLVTYNIAKDWDVGTVISNCTETGFEGVELRTTHAHKVETSLNADQRKEIRKKFESSTVQLLSLGSVFEYHAVDQNEVRKNVEGTKEYVQLAHDVGAQGIKVRPNDLQTDQGIPVERTLEQIGKALHECGEYAREYGIEIRVEAHGRKTSPIRYMSRILDFADSDNVFLCWNSNQTDLDDDGLDANFDLMKHKIHLVHMRDLFLDEYPWTRLFHLLIDSGYRGFYCAEIPESTDPIRVMKYYRALFDAYQSSDSHFERFLR